MTKIWCMILILLLVLTAFGSLGAQNTENLIAPYESGDKYFERYEIGDLIVYWHQRVTPGGAIVEKDFINYQFDKETKELLQKKMNWREDLTGGAEAVPLISEAQAMSMVPGAQFASLYVISPNSDVYPIKPTPTNPCWVVRSEVNGRQEVYIIDAMTGQDLGRGIVPPYNAFSLTGPDWGIECVPIWPAWAQNARDWFNAMGYSTNYIGMPTDAEVQSNIQNSQIYLFYELAHGTSSAFHNHCPDSDNITPAQIHNWIAPLRKFSFAFIGSCKGLCETGAGTFSYEFRKGSFDGAATVGYCGMDSIDCAVCWGASIDWQDSLFLYMNAGYSIYGAFVLANADYPSCWNNNCTRFAGDYYLKLKTREEIVGAGGTWTNPGIWYWNLATETWSRPYNYTPDRPGIPMAIGDINGDGKADMISCWTSGLWWQNAVTLGWNFVYATPPNLVAAGEITGDGRAEIVGTWGNGIWYRNVAADTWTWMYNYVPNGGIAVGDFTGDGRADVASIWTSGLWYQNGVTLGWTKVYSLPPAKITAGDITGDGRAEIVGTWNGIWYWNVAAGTWTQMYNYNPSGMLAAGDVSGDGRADVVSIWGSGLWYQNGRTFGWTQLYSYPPASIAVGNITGN